MLLHLFIPLRVKLSSRLLIISSLILHGLYTEIRSIGLQILSNLIFRIALLSVLDDVLEQLLSLIIVIYQIFFISYQNNFNIIIAVGANLFKPTWQVQKTLEVGDVINEKSTNGKAVVSGRDAQELFGT